MLRVKSDVSTSMFSCAIDFVAARSPSWRLERMLDHFGVDRERAVQDHWEILSDADRVCAQCTNVRRCCSWFSWDAKTDAPRLFCPISDLLDKLAREDPAASPKPARLA